MNMEREEQYERLIKEFDISDVWLFSLNHKIGVNMQVDNKYHCFIDYEAGDGSWGTALDPLSAIMLGIESYRNRTGIKPKPNNI